MAKLASFQHVLIFKGHQESEICNKFLKELSKYPIIKSSLVLMVSDEEIKKPTDQHIIVPRNSYRLQCMDKSTNLKFMGSSQV